MKGPVFLFIFLIFFDVAQGIAVTPPVLELNEGKQSEFIVINTNEFETEFRISAGDGIVISDKEFSLEAKGKKTVYAAINNSNSREGIIYVKEHIENLDSLRLENGIGIKYSVKPNGVENGNEITGAFYGFDNDEKGYWEYAAIAMLVVAVLFLLFYKNKFIESIREGIRDRLFYYMFFRGLK